MSRSGHQFEELKISGSTNPERGSDRDMIRPYQDHSENSNKMAQRSEIQMSRPGHAYVPTGTCIKMPTFPYFAQMVLALVGNEIIVSNNYN